MKKRRLHGGDVCGDCPFPNACAETKLCLFQDGEPIVAGLGRVDGFEDAPDEHDETCLHCALGVFMHRWFKQHPRPEGYVINALVRVLASIIADSQFGDNLPDALPAIIRLLVEQIMEYKIQQMGKALSGGAGQ